MGYESDAPAAARLGMWVFLATEVMLFGALFLGLTVYRTLDPEALRAASRHLDRVVGAVNTAVLLTSSLTMALAVEAARAGRRRTLTALLLVTASLGVAFLGIKLGLEYRHDWQEHLVPSLHWAFPAGENVAAGPFELLFVFYFLMTGLHALHLTVGIAILGWLAARAWLGRSRPEAQPVVVAGLYWHFVDVVWVFLYPALYLLRR